MRIIAISNQKGGVGKTTTAQALCAGLASRGFKVLGIDLDPQGNFSVACGADNKEYVTIRDVLYRSVVIGDAIQSVSGGYDVVPSNIMLATAEQQLIQTGKEFRLRESLEAVADQYDYVIIDTPPSLGVLTVNAFTACDSVIIPTTADYFATAGIFELSESIKEIKKYCNPRMKIAGILFTRFNGRIKIAQEIEQIAQELSEHIKVPIFSTKIRSSVAIMEAQARSKDIFDHAGTSPVAEDYTQFINEFLIRTYSA